MLQNEKILIVDDTPENLEILSGLLEGYDLTSAVNGETALQMVEKSKPDIILLDIMMPKINGFEVAKKLKKDKKTLHIPIIFITSKTDAESIVKGFSLGAADYITKPFEPAEVLARVKTHLEISRQRKFQSEMNEVLLRKVEERTKELRQAKEKAEDTEKLKTEFLAQMSHEIRTPLSAVISLSGILVEKLSNQIEDEYSDLLNMISNAGKRIIRTVELILNYSDVATGGYKPTFKKIDLSLLCLNIIEEYETMAKAENLILNYSNELPFNFVEIDEYSIRHVISNIIENAIIYTPRGVIDISLKKKNGKVLFECKDTGIGISNDYLEKIFEPFTQEDQGYTRKYQGNGLGLALVKRYCDINKTEIKIESIKSEGSVFTLKFK